VLIAPALARRERARLEEKAYLKSVLDVAALRRAAESQPAPVAETVRHRAQWRDATTFAKRRLVPAALLCSLAANGFLIAHVVARGVGEQATQVAVRMVTLTESTPTVPPVSAVSTVPGTKAAVERKVVALILSAPARRLPSHLIDSITGLVKNNVQVVCKKQQRRPSFLCTVRLSTESANKALFVRYQTDKNGRGAFKWTRTNPAKRNLG
ncbi:MAG: hypothetical protein ACXVRV_11345, partial [Gaiellaceae bacterium]